MSTEGRLVVVSGPSGAGKTTICRALAGRGRIVRSVSATTRSPRPGEVDGKDYFFLTKDEFEKRKAAGGFLEWAEYAGNLYGTPKEFVDRETARGKCPLLEIDVQGVEQLRKQGWKGVYIFIAPPSLDDLRKRLEGRGTKGPELERRLKVAETELDRKDLYDHVVVNDVVDHAIEQVLKIVDAEIQRKE